MRPPIPIVRWSGKEQIVAGGTVKPWPGTPTRNWYGVFKEIGARSTCCSVVTSTKFTAWSAAMFGPATKSDDVVQEAFIKAYRALPRFRGESAFYTWLIELRSIPQKIIS
jgi:hypothetical protein